MPVRTLTSRTAIKAYLSAILFLATSVLLLTISSTAYGFFYYNYIPQISLERVVYLQYGQGAHPHATMALDASALVSQQAYDVELVLNMPRTPTNLEAGNFMLDLALLGPGPGSVHARNMPAAVSAWLANITADDVLHHSRRPAILPYSSPILSLSHTLLHLPWHLLNFRDLDSARLVVPMFEMLAFARGAHNIPTHARLELQSSTVLQVYDAKLAFRAKFQGVRYLVYNYRVTAFLVFTALFYSVSVTTMAVAWAAISHLLSAAGRDETSSSSWSAAIKREGREEGGATPIKTEHDASSGTRVKTEEDTESSNQGLSIANISDTATQFPTRRGQPQLRYPGRAVSATAGAEEDEGAEGDLTRPIGPDEAADDEDDGDDGEEVRGRPFDGDSGIGTSMESEHGGPGLLRRRSSRGYTSKQ